MTNSHEPPANIWLRPAASLTALVLLAVASLAVAYLPLGPLNAPVNLAIAATMVTLLWLFLMDLIGADALVRLIAVAGLLWLSFMFVLTLSDYLFRGCETPDSGRSAFCVVQNIGWRVF
jgi:caa(3)-type oxidase subunit IV